MGLGDLYFWPKWYWGHSVKRKLLRVERKWVKFDTRGIQLTHIWGYLFNAYSCNMEKINPITCGIPQNHWIRKEGMYYYDATCRQRQQINLHRHRCTCIRKVRPTAVCCFLTGYTSVNNEGAQDLRKSYTFQSAKNDKHTKLRVYPESDPK